MRKDTERTGPGQVGDRNLGRREWGQGIMAGGSQMEERDKLAYCRKIIQDMLVDGTRVVSCCEISINECIVFI